MGIFSWLTRTSQPEETRDSGFLRFEDVFNTSANTFAGEYVSEETALTLPAVWRCVSLNAETIASLPVDCYRKQGDSRLEVPKPSWMARPSQGYSWFDFICEVQTSLELDGNAFILKVVASSGRLVDLLQLAPNMVQVERSGLPGNPIVYRVTLSNGTQQFYAENEVVHIRAMTRPRQLRGMSPISYLAQTIGLGLASQEFASNFFGSGATLSGVIEAPGAINEAAAERLQDAMQRKHGGVKKSHAVGVLTGGAAWKQLSVSPEESQFLLSQKFTATQIANFYGIPPEYVTEAEGAKGYVTGLYARQMLWLQTGLLPRIKRLETAFSSLLPGDGTYVKFNVDGLLRADPTERAALCTAMIMNKAMTPNEWRALEDMNPLPGGDEVLHSVQFESEVPL